MFLHLQPAPDLAAGLAVIISAEKYLSVRLRQLGKQLGDQFLRLGGAALGQPILRQFVVQFTFLLAGTQRTPAVNGGIARRHTQPGTQRAVVPLQFGGVLPCRHQHVRRAFLGILRVVGQNAAHHRMDQPAVLRQQKLHAGTRVSQQGIYDFVILHSVVILPF